VYAIPIRMVVGRGDRRCSKRLQSVVRRGVYGNVRFR
jgi:hypothetical protein